MNRYIPKFILHSHVCIFLVNYLYQNDKTTPTQNKPNAKEWNPFFEWETDSFPHLQSATELFEMTLFSGDDDGWCKIINAFPKVCTVASW